MAAAAQVVPRTRDRARLAEIRPTAKTTRAQKDNPEAGRSARPRPQRINHRWPFIVGRCAPTRTAWMNLRSLSPLTTCRPCINVREFIALIPACERVGHPSQDANVSALLTGSRLEFDHQVGGHPAAVFHFDALRPCPFTDPGGVQPARRSAAAAASRLWGAAAHPASIDSALCADGARPDVRGVVAGA